MVSEICADAHALCCTSGPTVQYTASDNNGHERLHVNTEEDLPEK